MLTPTDICKAGTYRSRDLVNCTTCPENSYSSGGAAECVKCASGTVDHSRTKCGRFRFVLVLVMAHVYD